jgi:hypothetical protein
VSEIETAWRTDRGIIRWHEGGYPDRTSTLRKGGNAFIRGDIRPNLADAWWMGREQTDLRILLRLTADSVEFSAWWARAGTLGSESAYESDGELLPVHLYIGADDAG